MAVGWTWQRSSSPSWLANVWIGVCRI